MTNYLYQQTLKSLYQHAQQQYQQGVRNADELFDEEQQKSLRTLGIKPIELYDFVDDFHRYGEPDWETVFAIQSVRRDYLKAVMHDQLSDLEYDPAKLPAKTDELDGIPWLPRIIIKAKLKLRGELHPDIMFCCGGDRNFLRRFDIHPADFLRAVWAWESTPERLIQWVRSQQG